MDAAAGIDSVGAGVAHRLSSRSADTQTASGRAPRPGVHASRKQRHRGGRWLIIAALLASSAVATWLYMGRREPKVTFKSVALVRGDLIETVNATGTVEPEELVDVGAQVAGKIRTFGEDPGNPGHTVDYGSQVEQGTVLASIDDALYAADVAANAALLEQAKATVLRAEVDIQSRCAAQDQAAATLDLAHISVDRINAISLEAQAPVELLTAIAQLKQAKAGYEIAKANVEVGRAALEQARKGVMQAEAALNRSKTNLEYCTIRSPVKGVIIDRRVNIGQTVVSSLNAPSLFLIARDLTRIQVWASVNEADIGLIRSGQSATFTVDAHPGRTFAGQVGKIRLNAAMTQNVVTYTVEVHTDNADGLLLPYLTANVQFQVATHNDVLMAPNMALHWSPSPDRVSRDAGLPGQNVNTPDEPNADSRRTHGVLWVVDGASVRPISVHTGATNGSQTEIEGNEIREGLRVVIGEILPQDGPSDTSSPFAPQIFRRR